MAILGMTEKFLFTGGWQLAAGGWQCGNKYKLELTEFSLCILQFAF